MKKTWLWIFALLSMIAPSAAELPARSDLWQRADLAPRERSIVTLAALIAQNQTAQMPCYFNLALENGVAPGEISEIITHLAFFSGRENALSAVAIAKDVFATRGIDEGQPAPTLGDLFIIIDELGSDEVVQSPHLLRSLWQRPDLSPRDRKLVTVSALTASGEVTRIADHI